MCDTLCILGDSGTLFAKNSDRPVSELQLLEAYDRRASGGRLRTQYLELPDSGAAATLLSRPAWLWGAEHGVNEHGVAIGNEMVNTVDDPRLAPPALLGMDLVRLGLERAASAKEALDVMTGLLERHGQGGVGDAVNDVAYWSSFLIADGASAWVLETSGRSWAARPVERGDAISNRLTLRRDWTHSSPGVVAGTDLDTWRDPDTPTGFADGRLAASRAFVQRTLGAPASGGPSAAARAWVALGNPCASVFVPVLAPSPAVPQAPVPDALAQEETARRFAALARASEGDPAVLRNVRAVLDEVESVLWDEADTFDADPVRWREFASSAEHRVLAALDTLADQGLGLPA